MRIFFKYFFKAVRLVSGPVVMLWELVTTPKGIVRGSDVQQKIDLQTSKLALYQFQTCPFCVKVRREIHGLSLNIELRDAQKNPTHRAALLQGGGKVKVPCLKIVEDNGDTRWLYESADIIQYFRKRFA
ncbi:MAG: glutathione S-transferase N-terminal domain-containing protein [Pseudomonadota bacterium]